MQGRLYLNEIAHLKIAFLQSTRDILRTGGDLMVNNSITLDRKQTDIFVILLPFLLDEGCSILCPVLGTWASFLEDPAHHKGVLEEQSYIVRRLTSEYAGAHFLFFAPDIENNVHGRHESEAINK